MNEFYKFFAEQAALNGIFCLLFVSFLGYSLYDNHKRELKAEEREERLQGIILDLKIELAKITECVRSLCSEHFEKK